VALQEVATLVIRMIIY